MTSFLQSADTYNPIILFFSCIRQPKNGIADRHIGAQKGLPAFTAGSPLVQPVTVPPQSALSDGLIYIFYIPEMLPSHGNPLIWVLAP